MFGAEILDLMIGLSFIYFILSLVCIGVNEMIASALGLRARTLRAGVAKLLGENPELLAKFCNHPLICSLSKGDWLTSAGKGPSYIPAAVFRQVLLAIAEPVQGELKLPKYVIVEDGASERGESSRQVPRSPDAAAQLRSSINAIADVGIRTSLQAVLDGDNLTVFQINQKIEQWFDNSMERVSGWYKRNVSAILLAVSVVIVCASNADTVRLAVALNQDNAAEAAVAAAIEQVAAGTHGNAPATPDQVATMFERVQELGLPLGWAHEDVPSRSACTAGQQQSPKCGLPSFWGWLASKVAGLAITVVAVSMGAPFWFETMQKLVPLRGTGKKPAKT